VRPTKYRLPASRQKKGHPFYWALVIALAAVLIWLWWQPGKKTSQRPPAKMIVTKLPPVANPARRAPAVLPPLAATTNPPVGPPSGQFPRPVQNIFEAQIALIGQGISSGSLDGALGSQTRAALLAFQKQEGLSLTGSLDAPTKSKLQLEEPPYATYTITSNDLARLQPIAPTFSPPKRLKPSMRKQIC
jgi:hypothetical protein